MRAQQDGLVERATLCAARSNKLFETIGDSARAADALITLGDIAGFVEGDWTRAKKYYAEALLAMEQLSPHRCLFNARIHARALLGLSQVAMQRGLCQQALNLLSQTPELARTDHYSLAMISLQQGKIYLHLGETTEAVRNFTEAQTNAWYARSLHVEAEALIGQALLDLAANDHSGAYRYLDKATQLAHTEDFEDVLTEIERIRSDNNLQ